MNATLELLELKTDLPLKQLCKVKEGDVIELLENEFPAIKNEFNSAVGSGNIYTVTQCFAEYTKQLIRKRNLKEVKHCFLVAEKMLKEGNGIVKNATKNCYVFSISRILDVVSPVSDVVKSLLTESLKREYNKQVCASGI